MPRVIVGCLLGVGMSAMGCAARSAHPEHASAKEPEPAKHSVYRPETWDEYYAEIAERARKHGIMVMWINPPSVRSVSKSEIER